MRYEIMLNRVRRELEFVPGREMADAALKAIWGIIVSSLDEPLAQRVTHELPEPLTLERLRGHQQRPVAPSCEELIAEIRTQFSLTHEQADELVKTCIKTGEQMLGDQILYDLKGSVPEEMCALV